MGAGVASCLASNGHRVHWVTGGRSSDTRRRAQSVEAIGHDTMEGALSTITGPENTGLDNTGLDKTGYILSICPPDNALEIASAVADAAAGSDRAERMVFVDCNAIAPVTMRAAASVVAKTTEGRLAVVDGGIVGPPPLATAPGQLPSTRLFLAGTRTKEVAALFAGSSLGAVVLDDSSGESSGIGSASALKMVYAAWTKGSAALMLEVAAAADAHGVLAALFAEWAISKPDLEGQLLRAAATSAPKAWRWKGEMEEIAATFAEKGLPAGMPLGAAEVYRRLADCKDQDPPPPLSQVIGRLLS